MQKLSGNSGKRATAKRFIIEDWTGKRLFPDLTFDTFEDGWSHIDENVTDEGDSTYDDYYVVTADAL